MIAEFLRERQEDCCKSMASVGYLVSARTRCVGISLESECVAGQGRKIVVSAKAIFLLL